MKDKFAVWTIGCQMNVADSERIATALATVGFEESDDIFNSNVSIVNSCVVRQSSEDKVTSKLDQLSKHKHNKKKANYWSLPKEQRPPLIEATP